MELGIWVLYNIYLVFSFLCLTIQRRKLSEVEINPHNNESIYWTIQTSSRFSLVCFPDLGTHSSSSTSNEGLIWSTVSLLEINGAFTQPLFYRVVLLLVDCRICSSYHDHRQDWPFLSRFCQTRWFLTVIIGDWVEKPLIVNRPSTASEVVAIETICPKVTHGDEDLSTLVTVGRRSSLFLDISPTLQVEVTDRFPAPFYWLEDKER